jgi:nucleoside phosphorylase
MTSRIPRLITALHNILPEIESEEIADICWLAVHLSQSNSSDSIHHPDTINPPNNVIDFANGMLNQPTEAPMDGGSTEAPLHMASEKDDYTHGKRFKTPIASALPGSLNIGRALRPLMRKVPSNTTFVIDEQATAHQIAEQRQIMEEQLIHKKSSNFPTMRIAWTPVLKPILRRWFEVALIVDASRSTVIWQQTIAELQLLLEQLGAFRDVKTWRLDIDEQIPPHIYVRANTDNTTQDYHSRRDPRELIDPSGQRLFLVITDCVSSIWEDGTMASVMNNWGQKNLVTVVQLLPERLWRRTGLRVSVPANIRIPYPGAPNNKISISSLKYRFDDLSDKRVAVPIVTLEPEALILWANAITGGSNPIIAGLVFDTTTKSTESISEVEEPVLHSAEQLLQHFRATTSPIARKLTGLAAAVPISLHTIRLVQRTMVKEANQIHVAEFFLSGLLEEIPFKNSKQPDYAQYDFISGVRELLLRSVPKNEMLHILRKVALYIEHNLHSSFDFDALLLDPLAEHAFLLDERNRPLALIASRVLRTLGGNYVELARKLERLGTSQITQKSSASKASISRLEQSKTSQTIPETDESTTSLFPSSNDLPSRSSLQGIVPITSSNINISVFGTGFIFYRDTQASYVLTCAHIVDAIGEMTLLAGYIPTTLVTKGTDDNIDLAILRVEGLFDRPLLPLNSTNTPGQKCTLSGYQLASNSNGYLLHTLSGTIGSSASMKTRSEHIPVKTWDINVADGYSLQSGMSGSPVIAEDSGQVIGVIYASQDNGKVGRATSIEMLVHIWDTMPKQFATLSPIETIIQSDIITDSNVSEYPTAKDTVIKAPTLKALRDVDTLPRKAVILTALRLEYMAVYAHLHNFREQVDSDGTIYEIGTFVASPYTWEVCIAEIGVGNERAALAAQSVINYFKPEVIFFVGVAGGLKGDEIALGDVVCATKVYGYEFGRDTEHGFKPRPEVGNSSYQMISRVQAEGRKDVWQKRVLNPAPDITPTVHIAPIAAGEKVVISDRVYKFLRDVFSDAIAVEMEGFGFLLAMHKNPEIDVLIIRGISDLIFDKTTEQDKKWQPIAARNASAFAFEMLAKLPIKDQATPSQTVESTQSARAITPPISGGNVTVSPSNNSIQIFYSYIRQDQALIDQLDAHLAVLKRHKGVVTSYAGIAGEDRMELLNQADIILLLISPNFLNSFDTYEKEVKRAMVRRKDGAKVIPVLLRPTANWRLEEFGGLMVVPRDKPVSAYSDKDHAFMIIAEEISAIVADIRKERGLL